VATPRRFDPPSRPPRTLIEFVEYADLAQALIADSDDPAHTVFARIWQEAPMPRHPSLSAAGTVLVAAATLAGVFFAAGWPLAAGIVLGAAIGAVAIYLAKGRWP
jgi:hypothetical protein